MKGMELVKKLLRRPKSLRRSNNKARAECRPTLVPELLLLLTMARTMKQSNPLLNRRCFSSGPITCLCSHRLIVYPHQHSHCLLVSRQIYRRRQQQQARSHTALSNY
jgi:hypothetical protein